MLVDVNDRDKEDVPLLHWAAINDRRWLVKYLLKQASNRLRDGALGVPRLGENRSALVSPRGTQSRSTIEENFVRGSLMYGCMHHGTI